MEFIQPRSDHSLLFIVTGSRVKVTYESLGTTVFVIITTYSLKCTFHLYRPQRSCGKVIFSRASVSHCSPLPWADIHQADTPLSSACWDTHTPPCPVRAGIHLPPPPRPAATAADGTHPSGMHIC